MEPISGQITRRAAEVRHADRRTTREPNERARGGGPFRLLIDQTELDAEITEVQHAEAPRKTEGNAQEESHEDRQSHNYYDARGAVDNTPPERHELDLEG